MVLISSQPVGAEARKREKSTSFMLAEIDSYREIVRRKANRHSRSFTGLEKEDLIQESFLLIVERLQSQLHQGVEEIEESLTREVENKMSRIKYAYRQALKQTSLLAHHETLEVTDPVQNQAELEEQRAVLENALNHLTLQQQEAVKFCFGLGQEKPQDQSLMNAEILRSRMRRGLKSLSKIRELRQLYAELSA